MSYLNPGQRGAILRRSHRVKLRYAGESHIPTGLAMHKLLLAVAICCLSCQANAQQFVSVQALVAQGYELKAGYEGLLYFQKDASLYACYIRTDLSSAAAAIAGAAHAQCARIG